MIVDIVEHTPSFPLVIRYKAGPGVLKSVLLVLSCYFSPVNKDSQWQSLLGKIQAYQCYVMTLIKRNTREVASLCHPKQNGYGSIGGGWDFHLETKNRGMWIEKG